MLLPAEIPCNISVNNSGDMELAMSPAGPFQLLKTLEHLRYFFLLFLVLVFGIVYWRLLQSVSNKACWVIYKIYNDATAYAARLPG